MKTLEQYLLAAGDEPYRCTDDDLVRQFLVETGNAGVLKAEGTEWTQYITVGAHPTHWMLFAFHHGYPQARDNGYNLLALPKKTYSRERATALINFIVRGASASVAGPQHLGTFDPKKLPGTN